MYIFCVIFISKVTKTDSIYRGKIIKQRDRRINHQKVSTKCFFIVGKPGKNVKIRLYANLIF